MKYTEDQKKAILTRHKNILVAAAAGSGKTRVLVDRIIHQLLARECSIEEMLVVTFTRAAAAEMRERIERALLERLETAEGEEIPWIDRQLILLPGAWISTFHSFCQRVIRQNIEAVDIDPQFRLASEQEIALMKRDVLEELFEALYQEPEDAAEDSLERQRFLSFSDAYGDDHGDESLYEAVLHLYTFCQSQPFPKLWLAKQRSSYQNATGNIWESPWLSLAVQETLSQLKELEELASSLSSLVKASESSELSAAWEPYRELIEGVQPGISNARAAVTRVSTGAKEAWDCAREAILAIASISMSGPRKPYQSLKENFPEYRTAFDELRKPYGDLLKKLKETAYFSDTAEEVQEGIGNTANVIDAYTWVTERFIDAFQAAKREKNILDFNDLEHLTIEILCNEDEALDKALLEKSPLEKVRTDVARSLQETFSFIMVDEYQDTNGVQEAILSLIAQEDNRFIVGDVKQSIYRFRLADPTLFQEKYDAFPEAPSAAEQEQLITMRQNFRSRAEVLEPINFLFAQTMTRSAMEIEYDAKSRLYPGASYPEENSLKGPVELDILLRTGEEDVEEDLEGFAFESQHIAGRILKLMASGVRVYDKDEGFRTIAFRDIAILLRAVSGKANELLEVLQANGIPAYAELSGGYFEASEVRCVLSLLAVLDNARQDIPLAAVLHSPIGGFSVADLARLRVLSPQGDLYDALCLESEEIDELDRELLSRAGAFLARLEAWRQYASSHSVPETIWKLYRDTGYYEYVGSLRGGVVRQANLRMLAERARDYENTSYRGLFRFQRFIDEMKRRETDLSTARTLGAGENVVRIMSVHKSKGLEFPVVFLADMGKRFNLKDARGQFLFHKEFGIGVRLVASSEAGRQTYSTLPWRTISNRIVAETKAEEMRILYVAMTRAKEKLILTGTVRTSDFDNQLKQGARLAEEVEAQLPDTYLQKANSYFDWIIPALMRHKDGKALRDRAGVDEYEDMSELAAPARFAVSLCQDTDMAGQEAHEETLGELFEAVQKRQTLPPSEYAGTVEHILGFSYDFKGLEDVPAKLSVTEIKRRFEAMEEEETPAAQLLKKDTAFLRPRFLQVDTGLQATERGTYVHAVLQHLDFSVEPMREAIAEQIRHMASAGWIDGQELTDSFLSSLVEMAEGFLLSPLGERVRAARQVWRELPFSRLFPAKRFFPAVKSDENVLVQGVLDILFQDESGRIVLIDYKTDRGIHAAEARERYKHQIAIYGETAEEILGQAVKERYLYLLSSGICVTMGRGQDD